MARWARGDIVVVLGAGATRGASWVTDSSTVLPPLNADFFTQLQRIQARKHQGVVAEILRDVVGLYGPNFQLTLEQYFTQLESLIQMTEVTLKNPRYTKERLERMRDRLLLGVSAVLEESADVVKQTSAAKKGGGCEHHSQIVEALSPRDTIISFNYDCVIDHALMTAGANKWSAQYGYGFPNPQRVKGFIKWQDDNAPHAANESINLLKLHGSLNFFPFPEGEDEEIRLRERTYRQTGNEKYEIVPPEFGKRFDRPVFKTLWKRAERAVRLARRITLIGFSFTPTDTHVDSFFRTALAQNKKLEQLIIVNPSVEDRRHIRSVFASQLSRSIRVTQFGLLKEFAPHARSLLNAE